MLAAQPPCEKQGRYDNGDADVNDQKQMVGRPKEGKEDSQQEYDADDKQRYQALLGCEVGLHGL